ncbi:MAG: glycogen/starch/alpha-glucan phosphorylase [Culicoidibacterales bacterium]
MINVETLQAKYLATLENRTGKKLAATSESEKYNALAQLSMELIGEKWKAVDTANSQQKEVHYFSMEFLLGRMLTNNLSNANLYDEVALALENLGIDINQLEQLEAEAGLGNGGLGRLAACFLDSGASLGLPLHGNTIRYQYGFFDQEIVEGKQVEHVQKWLYDDHYDWEVCREEQKQKVNYGGTYKQGIHTPDLVVIAIPYDIPVVGYQNKTINTLKMWSAKPDTAAKITGDFSRNAAKISQISGFLYPDDSNEEGQKLRLLQQYFFSSAGAQHLVQQHLKRYETLDNFHQKVTIQINDTHPTIVIPELMRLFIDEHNYNFDKAWEIISQTVAYTNHTLLAEALECWKIRYIEALFPHLLPIIKEIDKRDKSYLSKAGLSPAQIAKRSILTKTHIQMAYLAIAGSFSVNGVAQLHTDLLMEVEMQELHQIYPHKFNNKTNGITHRRWLMQANKELSALISRAIGTKWKTDLTRELPKLAKFRDDAFFLQELLAVKGEKKQQLADYIQQTMGIVLDPTAIFDIQVKRLHAYKRQILNALHILHLYLQLKQSKELHQITPRVFIFGAKAAPSYALAKEVIYFINVLADVINNDETIEGKLKVVFMPNYNVSSAAFIFPGADISEQISTAGKEASGTGNMKFMINGALTLGTLDGANVEIADLAGHENNFIFGMKVEEVVALEASKTYNTQALIKSSKALSAIFKILQKPTLLKSNLIKNDQAFTHILADLVTQNDPYYVLADFNAYMLAQQLIEQTYQNKSVWAKMMLANISQAGFFTSDRTIAQYNRDIWKIEQ